MVSGLSRDAERAGFLDAIRAEPAADAPRLIYADWLDDNGERLRASLIRYQVAAGGEVGLWPSRLIELIPHWDFHSAIRPTFRGGFVDAVEVRSPDDLGHLDWLRETETVGTVSVNAASVGLRDWFLSPAVRVADVLTVPQRFLGHPHFARLTPFLGCREVRVGYDGAWPGSGGPLLFPRADALDVGEFAIAAHSVGLLGWPPRRLAIWAGGESLPPESLSEVEELRVVGPPDVLGVADVPNLVRLETNHFDPKPWIDLLPRRAAGLKRLGLGFLSSRPPSPTELARIASACPGLESLALGMPDAKAELRRDQWPALARIDVSEPRDSVRLVGGVLPGLLELSVGVAVPQKIKRDHVGGVLPGLLELSVRSGPRQRGETALLRELTRHGRLERLSIGAHVWDARAWREFLSSPCADGLRFLDLCNNPPPGRIVRELCEAALPNLEALQTSYLDDEADAAALVERFGPRYCGYWWA